MKPTGRSDFAFDPGLVVCLRDDIEDCELQVSFEGSFDNDSFHNLAFAGFLYSLLRT